MIKSINQTLNCSSSDPTRLVGALFFASVSSVRAKEMKSLSGDPDIAFKKTKPLKPSGVAYMDVGKGREQERKLCPTATHFFVYSDKKVSKKTPHKLRSN